MAFLEKFKKLFVSDKLDVNRRFDILREASFGTMSKCYKVRDRNTRDVLALKVMDKKKTEQHEQRFAKMGKPSEGQIAMQLSHPQIVQTLEYGTTTLDEPYLVMEYLNGNGLHTLLRSMTHDLDGHRLRLLRQGAEAIHAVHSAGFIHRDICPRNFIVTEDMEALKLIDFGLTVPATAPFIRTANRTGTPNYMAPEIARRQNADIRVDVFAFGVTAYEMCSFQLPWHTRGDGKAAMMRLDEPPLPLHEHAPWIHPQLEAAIMGCITNLAIERTETMAHFLRDIRDLKSERR